MDRRREFPDAEVDSWLEREIASCRFDDVRHGKRLGVLLDKLSERIAGSIPFACQDWAATKAAYRFFSNARISEDKILAGHFLCTRERFASARGGPVLVLHDTSEFVYRSEENEAIGMVSKQRTRSRGRPRYHTMRGVLMHSSLVVTQQGLPLGLAAIKFWTRDKFHGANALKRTINPTRVPIQQKESYRWLENVKQSTALLAEPKRIVHIGDRESDIYELFCTAHDAGTHFLLRTCVDRLAGDGDHTIADEMREVRVSLEGCIALKCGTRGEKETKPLSRFAIGESRFFPQSPNRSCAPRSNSPSSTPPSRQIPRTGTGSTGS